MKKIKWNKKETESCSDLREKVESIKSKCGLFEICRITTWENEWSKPEIRSNLNVGDWSLYAKESPLYPDHAVLESRLLKDAKKYANDRQHPIPKLNAGYNIIETKSSKENDFCSIVLAYKQDKNMTGPECCQYVTWVFNHDNQGFHHGHYFSTYSNATKDFQHRD